MIPSDFFLGRSDEGSDVVIEGPLAGNVGEEAFGSIDLGFVKHLGEFGASGATEWNSITFVLSSRSLAHYHYPSWDRTVGSHLYCHKKDLG